MEEERKQDRKLQMKILKNLADGYMSRSTAAQSGRGHYGIDELTKGDIRKQPSGDGDDDDKAEDEEVLGEGDFEDDEVLQGKLLSSFTERAKARRDAAVKDDAISDVELSEEESDVSDLEDDNAGIL